MTDTNTPTIDHGKCVICHLPIAEMANSGWLGGNNALPVREGQCCDVCNATIVVPARLREFTARRQAARVEERLERNMREGKEVKQ